MYRFKELYEEQGAEGLRELSRRKPNPKNRVDPVVEEAVLAISLENPVRMLSPLLTCSMTGFCPGRKSTRSAYCGF